MMKNKRTFFGRLLRGTAVTALSAVLFSALPVLKADAAAGSVTLSADGTLTLSGEVTREQIRAYRDNDAVKAVTAKKGTVLPANCSWLFQYYRAQTIDLSNASSSEVTDMSRMFSACDELTSLDLSSFDTSNVTNMEWMFSSNYLTSLDLSSFDTSNVTSMGYMFNGCTNLTSLDLSSFDTSNVTNMERMFRGCEKLTSLDLSSFDTSNVTSMGYMFNGCTNLTSLDLSSFDTSNVTEMGEMFSGCKNLTSLDLSSFDTSNVTDMSDMFYGLWNLTSLDLSGFDTSSVKKMSSMFNGCKKLTSLDLSSFDTSNVTNMENMFASCFNLTSLDLSSFDTSGVKNMSSMFNGCEKLTSLDLSGFDTSNVTNMENMFASCSNLTSLDLSSFDTSNVTDMGGFLGGMFRSCRNLTSLDLSSFDTSKVTDMEEMFEGCKNLTSLDLSSFDTSNVTEMGEMFSGCKNLTSLDLSGFDTSNVTDMHSMFNSCSNLTAVYVSDRWSNQSVRSGSKMFEGCASLTGGNGTKYTDDHMDQAYARIDTADLPGYFTDSFFNAMPKNAYGMIGENAVFTVKAAGKNLKYQWQYNNGSGWRNSTQEGCKTAALSVPVTNYRDGQQYRCVVTDAAGKKHISSAAKLYVIQILAQPEDVSVLDGETAVFTVRASGSDLKYCWQYNNGHGWQNSTQEGCKTAELSVCALYYRNGQQYRCVITDAAGKKCISSASKLYVIQIPVQPEDVFVSEGETAVFTVRASGSDLKYCWQYNNGSGWRNSTLEGSNTAELSVCALYYRNGQQYRCVITDASGEKSIGFAAAMYIRLITVQPTDVSAVIDEQNAVFTVQTAGYNLNYCWQFNNGHGWKNSSMTGCKTAVLTVPAIASREGQRYRCIVTAPNGIREISKEVTMFVE